MPPHLTVEQRQLALRLKARGLSLACPGLAAQAGAWPADWWPPVQISRRLRIEYPGDPMMRVSHETIYQALYVQGRGELRRELARCLRLDIRTRTSGTRCPGSTRPSCVATQACGTPPFGSDHAKANSWRSAAYRSSATCNVRP